MVAFSVPRICLLPLRNRLEPSPSFAENDHSRSGKPGSRPVKRCANSVKCVSGALIEPFVTVEGRSTHCWDTGSK